MKISLNWLQRYLASPLSAEDLENIFPAAGLSVENIQKIGADFPHVVVARILESQPHPNADRLSVCQVDDGSGQPRQIVCGAKNYKVGARVPLALPGAELPGGLKIKTGRLRGVESQGMMCSARELGLAGDAVGLLILPPDVPPGLPIGKVFPPDVVFELEVTPNRPDCLGHLGVAREVAAFSGAGFLPPGGADWEFRETDAAVVHEEKGCPFYTLARLRDATVGPPPEWMARDLQAVGLRSINAAVDVTNWVMMETGQPLHVFDAAKVRGRVSVRKARPGESLEALDGKTYHFEGTELLIADEEGPLAIAGIVGGVSSSVGVSTREILLESAVFDAAWIRRTARKLGAATDSSHRFERGVDPLGTLTASRRAAALLAELTGAEVAAPVCRCGPPPSLPEPVPLRPARCRHVLGAEISDGEMRRALESLGLSLRDDGLWQVPGHRRDLVREADLIEEVARRVGIDRIPGRLAARPAPASPADAFHDLVREIANRLAAMGLSEARSPVLVSEKAAGACGEAIALRNPLGADQSFLRPSLLPGLLDALRRNLHAGAQTVGLFETGKIFRATGPEEQYALGILMHGLSAPPGWRCKEPRAWDFHDLKGLVEALWPGTAFQAEEPGGLLALRVGVLREGTLIGAIGQLAPAIARELDARGPVLLGEFTLDLRLASRARAFAPIPAYPASRRDVAIVAPLFMAYGSIAREIEAAREPLLASFEPLDVYTDPNGEKIPADVKSVALALTFASTERTLTSEEVTDATERIKARLRDRLGVGFRE